MSVFENRPAQNGFFDANIARAIGANPRASPVGLKVRTAYPESTGHRCRFISHEEIWRLDGWSWKSEACGGGGGTRNCRVVCDVVWE